MSDLSENQETEAVFTESKNRSVAVTSKMQSQLKERYIINS